MLPAQRLADLHPVSEEHGRRGDARRVADGRRQGSGAWSPAITIRRGFLHFELRSVCESSRRGDRHPDRCAGKLSAQGQGELAARRLEQRMVENGSPATATGAGRCSTVRGPCCCRSERPAPRCCSRARSSPQATSPRPSRSARLRDGSARNSNAVLFATSQSRRAGARLRSAIGRRQRASSRSAISGERRRDADLVPNRAGAHGDLGRQPVQVAVCRRRSEDLSPRRSFAQWHQIVEGTSDPWTAADHRAARLIGASVTDVVMQFRAVRVLMAQDQLDQVLRRRSRVRPADRRGGRPRLDPRMQCRVQRAARRRSRRVARPRGPAGLLRRPGRGATKAERSPSQGTAVARRGEARRRTRRNEARARAGGRGPLRAGPGAGLCPAAHRPH